MKAEIFVRRWAGFRGRVIKLTIRSATNACSGQCPSQMMKRGGGKIKSKKSEYPLLELGTGRSKKGVKGEVRCV